MKFVMARSTALSACTAKHPVKAEEATADLLIDHTGTPESVRFEPAEVDTGPLGGCLRLVLNGIAFAKRNASTGLHVDISLPPKRR